MSIRGDSGGPVWTVRGVGSAQIIGIWLGRPNHDLRVRFVK